jgi:hypothetical protein
MMAAKLNKEGFMAKKTSRREFLGAAEWQQLE